MNKFCPRCNTDKSTTEFQKNAARGDGLSGWCKVCMREATREWKKRNPEINRLHARIYYQNRKLKETDG